MSFLYMEFSWEEEEEDQYVVEKRESIIPLIDEPRNSGGGGGAAAAAADMMTMGRNEFWPIEHPIEPLDGDRPVKCPIPNSSSLINKDGSSHKEPFSDSLRKKRAAAQQVSNKEPRLVVAAAASPPVRALRKRHHTLTRTSVDHAIKPLLGISDMLHHFGKFES